MNSKSTTNQIRLALNRIDELAALQADRGANDYRRKFILDSIRVIESLSVELKRKNQDG